MTYPGVELIDVGTAQRRPPSGSPSAQTGELAYRSIAAAVECDAQAAARTRSSTAPISKEALHLAGSHYPGHTELLADLTGVARVR